MSSAGATNPDAQTLRELLTFAVEIAEEAGEHTLRYFRQGVAVERKQDESPVTVADRETERLLRARISTRYADHRIVGEEYGTTESSSPWTWIIDPIDGTKSFIHGIPLYTVLIALTRNGKPLLGVIHNPVLEETVAAASGLGSTLNGHPCSVRSGVPLSDAWIQVTDPADLFRRRPEFSSRLFQAAGSVRTWADAYGYLLVATGRADGMVDPVMNLWDVAPLVPILTEAGGLITDFTGGDAASGESAIAGTPEIQQRLLELALETDRD